MPFLFAGFSLPEGASVELIVGGTSLLMTAYFWLVKARNERPCLDIYQLSNFRSSLRRSPDGDESKRLCLSQIDTGGVLVANNSTRQNSIIRFDCFLNDGGEAVKGWWGYTGDDKPPWNIPPETTIAMSPACFFEVPADYVVPDDVQFRIEFVTVSGRRFSHEFSLKAPQL